MRRFTHILVDSRNGIARVTLNKPDRRNAFDDRMAAELHEAFKQLGKDPSVRVIILAGAGPVFCAGADLQWMSQAMPTDEAQAVQDAERIMGMYRAIDEAPCPVIAQVQGRAFGGGVGLVAVCDIAVAAEDTVFGLSEVKLGLIPAIIAPFLLRKIGESCVRRYALTGEPFPASVAKQINLVHNVAPAERLEEKTSELAEQILHLAPHAVHETKALLRQLATDPGVDHRAFCTQANARVRASEEAREGIRAFLEKRMPAWSQESHHGTGK